MARIKTTRSGQRSNRMNAELNAHSKRPLIHLADRIFGTPLMVHQNKLRVILEELGGRIDPLGYQSALEALPFEANIPVLSALSLREASDRKSYAVTDSGIAIIPVSGLLMKKSTWMSSLSGMCTYEDIADQFSEAMADPTVRGIVLDVDSPGGETHGAFELSDLIYQARNQGKPIYAAANDLAASAAYSTASAAERIFNTRTGAVGSIGVYSLHCSQKSLDEKMGLSYTYISAGEYKVDGNPHSDLTDTARAHAQSEVDRQYGMFVATVARNRNAKASAIAGTKALCYFAENSTPLLADEVGTLEDCIEAMEAKLATGATRVGSSAPRTISLSQDQLQQLNAGTPVVITPTATATKEALPMSAPNATATALTVEEQLAALQKENAQLKAQAAIAAAAASPKIDPEDCPDMPDNDDDEKAALAATTAAATVIPATQTAPARTAPVALPAASPVRRGRSVSAVISEDCILMGCPERTASLILAVEKGETTLAKIREQFLAERSATSHANMTSNGHSGTATSGSPLDRMEQQAVTLVQNSGGNLSKAKAYERVLMSNPMLYRDYVEEKDEAALTPGRRRAYLDQMGPKMASMGLGSQFVRQ